MKGLDIRYLCTAIGNLSGVPIRIFESGEPVFFYSQSSLPRDPMDAYREEIFAIRAHVGYVTTRHFHYYGIVNSGETKIVIGPTRQIAESDQELRELAFQVDVAAEDIDAFIAGMKGIIRLPFESMVQTLCTMNHVLNGEKLSLKDIAIYDAEQERLALRQGRQQAEHKLSALTEEARNVHNTFDQEQAILNIVRRGDTAALREWAASAPAIRGGILKEEDVPEEVSAVAGRSCTQRLDYFIHNIVTTSRGRDDICMSKEAEEAMRTMREFMFRNVYRNPIAKSQENKAENLVVTLYEYYMNHTEKLPKFLYRLMEEGEPLEKIVCDYIGSMTDRFAIAQYQEIYIPKTWHG